MLKSIINHITKGDERSVKVKKNFIASLGIKGVSIAITFFLVPITLGYVSDELYGIWLILSSLLLMVQYFDVGFTLGLKNKLAEAIAVKDYERGKELVSTTYLMLILIFIPIGVILQVATPFVPWARFFNVNEVYNPEIIKALHIMFACICLQMIVNAFTAVLSAYQRTATASFFPVLGNFFSLILIIALTKFSQPSLANLALAISTMPVIVVGLASLILYRTKYKPVAPSISCTKKSLIKDLFQLGAKFFIIQVQIIVLYQATNILISNVSNPIEVANYNVAYKYINISLMVFNILLTPLWPAFTDAYVKRDFKWMNSIYRKLMSVLFLLIGVIIIMTLVSPFVYKLWVGDRMNIPFIMTVAVAIYVIIHAWDSLQVMLINGIGAIKLQTYVTLIGLVLNIPLSLFLGKYLGAVGVVTSMAIINLIYSTVFTVQLRKILNQTANGIWKS